jgi:hypothetical protein
MQIYPDDTPMNWRPIDRSVDQSLPNPLLRNALSVPNSPGEAELEIMIGETSPVHGNYKNDNGGSPQGNNSSSSPQRSDGGSPHRMGGFGLPEDFEAEGEKTTNPPAFITILLITNTTRSTNNDINTSSSTFRSAT